MDTQGNELYRDRDLSTECFFDFFKDRDVMPIKTAEKLYEETHRFTAEHPLRGHYAIAKVSKTRVAFFPWHWLGSTNNFGGSLLDPVLPAKESTFFKKREIYCRRFLTLFKPFRKFEDILGGGMNTIKKLFGNMPQSLHPLSSIMPIISRTFIIHCVWTCQWMP